MTFSQQQPTQRTTMNNTETTDTPPSPLSNAEAVQILTDGRFLATLTARQKEAILRAVHLVARRDAQRVRWNHRKADKGAFFTPRALAACGAGETPTGKGVGE